MENLRKKFKTTQETSTALGQSQTKANTVDQLQSPSFLDDRIQLLLEWEESIREQEDELNELKRVNDSYKQELLLNENRIKQLTYEIGKLKEEYSLEAAEIDENEIVIDKYQRKIDDSALQLENSNDNDLSEDCLIEIFSYLSVEDMLQTKKVCKKWYQVSQQWFKQVQTLVYTQRYFEKSRLTKGTLELYENNHKRKIYEKSEKHGFNDLISILRSCGHHIKYYKLSFYRRSKYCCQGRPDKECEKFIFQCVPKLCKNIVEFEIDGDKYIYKPLTFEIMAIHWRKLEKINIKFLRQPVDEHFYNLLRNNQQLKSLTVWFDLDARCRLSEIFFDNLSRTIEEIELGDIWISDSKVLKYLKSANENFPSLKSLKFANIPRITDDMAAAISKIKLLNHLDLFHNRYESCRALDSIANLKNLKSFVFSTDYDLYEDNIINIVESCVQLEYLDLHRARLTDKGMTAIARMKKLKCLYIDMSNMTDESIFNLPESLEVLCCDNTEIKNIDAIKLLKKGRNLRYVDFGSTSNLTEAILRPAMILADGRKNILCITGYLNDNIDEFDTENFKYFPSDMEIPMDIFPNDIRNYIKLLKP